MYAQTPVKETLSHFHQRKVDKYARADLESEVRKMEPGVDIVRFGSVCVNWRGCVAGESAKQLREMGCADSLFSRIAQRALFGSSAAFGIWRRYGGWA